ARGSTSPSRLSQVRRASNARLSRSAGPASRNSSVPVSLPCTSICADMRDLYVRLSRNDEFAKRTSTGRASAIYIFGMPNVFHRRNFLSTALGAAAVGSVASAAFAQEKVNTVPAPRDWSGVTPSRYPDPDVVSLDPRFDKYIVGNTPMQRLFTGTFWSEGPAWNGVGRYFVWSDIPNNRQMRWLEEDGRVSVFRSPSNYSNGNTFDYEGRQLSCEHAGRRVVRYEYNGTTTV